MKLQKTDEAAFSAALPSPMPPFGEATHVQGASVQTAGSLVHIVSGGRFKRFPAGSERIRIERGAGYFKWARGETPFAAGETFLVQACGEYEINGACAFIVARRT